MSEEEQRPERRRVLDEVGTVEFMSEFFKFFGTGRGLQLLGWVALWGVQGIENGPAFREELKRRGISRATAYRASLDLRRFRQFVEFRVGHPVTNEELLEDLKQAEDEGKKHLLSLA
jgi:hypothetical protein